MRASVLFAPLLLALGCDPADKPPPPADKPPEKTAAKPGPVEPARPKPVEGERTALNKQKTLFLEKLPGDRRRVVIQAAVCLREGQLELLLCRKQTKEHEAIVQADVNAQQVHATLMVCKAKPGSPVKYTEDGKIIPPSGTPIRVTLRYEKKPGDVVEVDARQWVRNARTRRELDRDWVFAGSALWQDEDDPKKTVYYLANNGNVISVANFPDAMLDLPINSSKENAELAFEAWTERIPPLGTKVEVILEPVPEEKKK